MKMHESLQFVTLDEFAECYDGVTAAGLYGKLWELMPADEDIPPQGEWPEPDSANRRCRSLAKAWDKFSEEEQAKINEIAAVEWAKWNPE